MREGALDILRSDALEPIVEMALLSPGDDTYEAVAHDGRVRFRREADGAGWRFAVEEVEGRDPLADQAVDRFAPLADEMAARFPTRDRNSYPHAYEQVAQLFDHRSAPDICVVHTAAHFWNHVGEHGSIDAVQARAPFVVAGAGVARWGLVPESCRLVDVAPTILRLLGAPPVGGVGPSGAWRDDALLARQAGDVVEGVVDASAGAAEHVVGFLFDGANANVLYDMALRGELPNVAALMAEGTAYAHGAMASLPTVTLANHTSVLTGCFPGHHGVLHNAWFDRATGQRAVTNSPDTWPTAMRWLADGVETVHHAVRRAGPGAVTGAVNEPCDAGASWSTFGVIREGGPLDRPPALEELPHTTHDFARPVKEYRWSSLIDQDRKSVV
jgi:phosphonoacetate hydrolase